METILKCDKCGREAHNPSFEGRVCSMRQFDGKHCDGILRPSMIEPAVSFEPHLICDMCGRRADEMRLKDKVCDWRLANGRHCQGVLREPSNESGV